MRQYDSKGMNKRKPRVVVDTNLLVSGLIYPHSTPSALLQALRNKVFTLVASQYLLDELKAVLARPKFKKYNISSEEVRLLVHTIKVHKQKTPSFLTKLLPLRDQKDEDILACALYGKADYLITGDKDLLVLKNNPQIRPLKIITAREFFNFLSTN